MLETLRALRQAPAPRHPIVFLFNGAEESLQQGSHAFSAHHPWAKDVAAIVNLDSAGACVCCVCVYVCVCVCVSFILLYP